MAKDQYKYKHEKHNNITGYRGKSYDASNLNSLPADLLKRMESSGVIVKIIKTEENGKEK